jgi:hypothetical protein
MALRPAIRVLVAPEYWLPHIHYLIQAMRGHASDDFEVYRTDDRWWRDEEHGPRSDTDRVSALPVDQAARLLADGWFDVAVFSEGTMALFLATKADGETRRVFLDSADHRYLVEPFLDASHAYLKCQTPANGKMLVGNSVSLDRAYGGEKAVLPWPYCPSSWIDPSWEPIAYSDRRAEVHFRGWAWPARRVDAVDALRLAEIPLRGGLYHRSSTTLNSPFHESLRTDRLPFDDYLREMSGCLVALNTVGNGEACFRTCEIWRSGTCMLTLPVDVTFPGRPPRHMEEWVVVEDKADLPEVARALLAEPELCARIGEAGRRYWETFQGPAAWARRFESLCRDLVCPV